MVTTLYDSLNRPRKALLPDGTNATPAQLAEGIQWLQRAAEQNLAVAQAGMGTAYFQGQIVAKDFPKAWKWMRAAAAQELPYALTYLGIAHFNGWGTQGDPTAQTDLGKLRARLTPEQLKDAERRVAKRNW